MFNSTQTKRNVFGAAMLALTMAFGSAPAQAIPVSFDLFYTHDSGISKDNTFIGVTIFLDDDDFTGSTAAAALSTVDVTFRQSGEEDIFFPSPITAQTSSISVRSTSLPLNSYRSRRGSLAVS